MIIKFHKHFLKAYQKLSSKEQDKVDERLRLFAKTPFDETLENHALSGKYQGYRSVNITGDQRAIYFHLEKEKVMFVRIGTHSQLYG